MFLLFIILHFLVEMHDFFCCLCLVLSFFLFQIVHFVNRDSLSLANDFLSLGFIPEGVDIHSVSDALQASFGDRTGESQDFQVCFACILLPWINCLLCNSCNWC